MAGSINRVVLVGNLTRDPEPRQLPSGTSVCSLGIAVNDRIKDKTTGEWTEYANFIDVDVFGAQGESCARFLSKGRQVAIEGKLRWRSWEKDGQKRSKVSVVADNVQFIGPREGGSGGGESAGGARSGESVPFNDGGLDVAGEDFARDDDIPF